MAELPHHRGGGLSLRAPQSDRVACIVLGDDLDPSVTREALECFGGNGYVETGPMARLFRESPLNGIWEGSGNVIALDVLRAITREPESLTALLTEIETATAADSRFDRYVADLHAELAQLGAGNPQAKARRLTERLALALQGSLLLRHSIAEVADAFCASRLAGVGGLMFGALPDSVDAAAILERAWPETPSVRTESKPAADAHA